MTSSVTIKTECRCLRDDMAHRAALINTRYGKDSDHTKVNEIAFSISINRIKDINAFQNSP
jgi:hypothetical protein